MNKKGLLAMALALSVMAVPVITACDGGQTDIPDAPVELDESIYGKAMNDTFFNPIRIDDALGDPCMIYHDGYYYFSFSEGDEVTITKSKSMTQMTEGKNNAKTIVKQSELAIHQLWAPDIFFFDGHFYCYYTATTGFDADIELNRRIYVSRSVTDDALGEWEHFGKMDLPCDYWAIDATYFAWQGHHYIAWSGNPNEGKPREQRIYMSELQPNDPTKVISTDPSARIQLCCPVYPEWENVTNTWLNEGPAFVVSPNGRPYLFYSAESAASTAYCLAYSELQGDTMEEMLANILNPEVDEYGNSVGWKKQSTPFMTSSIQEKEVLGPGHNYFTKSPDGTEDYIVYHSTKQYYEVKNREGGWDRMARLQKLSWKDDKPYLETYPHFSEETPLPSGEKVNRRLYEAEDAVQTAGCTLIDGTGERNGNSYVYASGGKAIQLTQEGDKITFNVTVPENGQYILQIRYSSTSEKNRMNVKINGKNYDMYAPRGQSETTYLMTGTFVDLYVKDKPNTVEITCDSDVYIDCLIVDYLER